MKALARINSTAAKLSVKPPAQIPSSDREIELKFLVSEVDFKAIQHSALLGSPEGSSGAQRLHSIYFDTDAGDLRRQRIILRIRRLRNGRVLTLKWPGRAGGGTFERGEIEVSTQSSVPDPLLLGEDVAAEIIRVTDGRPLQACFVTDIKRVVRRVIVGASEIEVAFDTGFIVCGEQKSPVREIELELKTGDPTDLYHFGLSLAQDYPVQLGIMTKAERGTLLSSGAHTTAVRAVSPVLADQTVDQAIGAIISACLSQFVANWPAFEGPDRAESVHQMRIAMRRLRAALALFHHRFPCAEFKSVRAQAKQIASAMGEARNWDVLAAMVREGPSGAFPSEPGFEPLMAAAEAQRQIGYDRIAELLAHVETTRFVLSVEAFVSRRGWRNILPGAELPRLTEGASGFAAECLERLHRRVRKRGKKLIDLPPQERHAVRIALKNLRYAADFFGNLFDHGGSIRFYTHAAARLQDALGSVNDIVMVTDLVEQLDLDSENPARAAGIIIGWYGREALVNDAALRDAWRAFRKAKPFWTPALPEPEGAPTR
jgi:triphosphatase